MERALALRAVMDHVVESATMPGPERRSRARRVTVAALSLLLLGASVYSWLARPEHIWGPTGRAESPVIDRASARLAMFVIAQRVEAVRGQTGHYPLSLGDIGEPGYGVRYDLLGDTGFVLRADASGEAIEYRSTQPLEEFLGRSADLISRARP